MASRGEISFPRLGSSAAPAARMAASPSYADVASGRAREMRDAGSVSKYFKMLMDPLSRDAAQRYPDETIIPTAMTHFVASETFVVPEGLVSPAVAGSVVVTLQAKALPSSISNGCGFTAQPLVSSGSLTNPVGWDYGGQQSTYLGLSVIERTLAAGIRTRVTALPTSTFLPSGTLYFLQVQPHEYSEIINALGAVGESVAIQSVTAGKGFSMTVNELNKLESGVMLPLLPQGPMSYVFSDTKSAAAQTSGAVGGGESQVVSALPALLIVGFGLQPGMSLRFDKAHHIEYVPTPAAAGLIKTEVCPPSVGVRERIATVAQQTQVAMAGSTSASSLAASVGSVAGGLLGLVPGGQVIRSGLRAVGSAASALLPSWASAALGAL